MGKRDDIMIKIIEIVLPIVVLLIIGYCFKIRNIIQKEGINAVRALISNVFLPAALFKAFYTAEFSASSAVIVGVVFTVTSCAFIILYLLFKNKANHKFTPFLLVSGEGGLIGYALYFALTGRQGEFAIVDLGQVVFAFTIYITILKVSCGKEITFKNFITTLVTNKCFLAVFFGFIINVTGIAAFFLEVGIHDVTLSVLNMLSGPTGALVLVMVGFDLNLDKKLLKPVAQVVVMRFVVSSILFAITAGIIFSIIPFDPYYFLAIMMLFAVPASFIIPVFVDVEDDGNLVSTMLSAQTLFTVVLFAFMTVYAKGVI